MAKFIVYLDGERQWRWRLRASNNRIVADSAEGYVSKQSCLEGIAIVKREAPTAPVVEEATRPT